MNALALSLSLLFGAVKTSPPAYDPIATALAIELALAELNPPRPTPTENPAGRGVGEPAFSPANTPHDVTVRAAAGGAITHPAVVYGWYETRECSGSRCVTTRRYGPLDAATMQPLSNFGVSQ